MMIGYGEDSLTYHVLTTQLRQFLDNVHAPNVLFDDVIFFYRPSFGRGKNIGEFDAIIGTKTHIYLIESKWHESGEVRRRAEEVILDANQVKRHRQFSSLLNIWRTHELDNWDDLLVIEDNDIVDGKIHGWKIPASTRKLAENLQSVIVTLLNHAPNAMIKNIILLIHPENLDLFPNTPADAQSTTLEDLEFELVKMTYTAMEFDGIPNQDRFFLF
jgi:hypothetical protein